MKTLSFRCSSVIALFLTTYLAAAVNAQQANPAPASTPSKPPAVASAPAPAASAEKVVLKVGNEQVTQADLDFVMAGLNQQGQQTVATQGRRPVGEQYGLMILLSQQAVANHLDAAPTFRRQAELQRLQMLAQAEYQYIAGQTTISPEEVGKYFAAHQAEFDEAQIRQIVVRRKPDGAKEGTPGLTTPQAKARIEAIRQALAGGADINKVANDFKVPNDVLIETEPRTVKRGQLLAALDKPAFELKEGALSEIAETPQALVFIQLVSRHHAELKAATPGIEDTLRRQKLEVTVNELKKKTPIWMDDDYFKAPAETPTLTNVPTGPGPTQP